MTSPIGCVDRTVDRFVGGLLSTTGRIVPADQRTRAELVDDARQLARERGGLAGLAEVGAIVSLALELRAVDRSNSDNRVSRLRHGCWLGGELGLANALVIGSADLAGSGLPLRQLVPLAAPALILLAVAAGLGRRHPRAAAVVAGLASAVVLAIGQGDAVPLPAAVLSLVVVAVAALLIGRPGTSRATGPALALVLSSSAALAVAVAATPASSAAAGPWLVLALIIALLATSRVDPGLGAAGAVLALWRFVIIDPSGLIVVGLTMVGGGLTAELTARWLAMAAGLVFAGLTVHRGLKEAATI